MLSAEVEWLDPVSGELHRKQQLLRVARLQRVDAGEAAPGPPDPLVVVTSARYGGGRE